MPPEAKYRQFGLLTFLSGVVRHLLDRRRAAANSSAPLADQDFIKDQQHPGRTCSEERASGTGEA